LDQIEDKSDLEAQLLELREWVRANIRRIEELEATAFRLLEEEEVIIIAVPK